MTLSKRIAAFIRLGKIISKMLGNGGKHPDLPVSAVGLSQLIHTVQDQNPWFTPENVTTALSAIARSLTPESLATWISMYPALKKETAPRRIGVMMAGNIPLVGFHDFLSVLMTGHQFIGKLSSKDDRLLPAVAHLLTEIEPEFSGQIDFSAGDLTSIDAIIATGSDNSARYFDYYFARYPNIIRRNRNGIAILDGLESRSELNALGEDIFCYFGLGCRSISKLFVPENFDFTPLTNALQAYSHLADHKKYKNNYTYNRARYTLQQMAFIDAGFLLLREEDEMASPPGIVYFEYYNQQEELKKRLDLLKDKIQCTVSHNKYFNSIGFGKSQYPDLWEYADGIDTMKFLLSLNN
jgi:hypothetical protein